MFNKPTSCLLKSFGLNEISSHQYMHKTSHDITYECAKWVRMFIPGENCQPSLIFVSKNGVCPCGSCSVRYLQTLAKLLGWRHDTQHNGTLHRGLIRDRQHNDTQHNYTLPVIWMLLCLLLRFIYCYAECHYAECRYTECRCAECHYAECRGAVRISHSKNFILFVAFVSKKYLKICNMYAMEKTVFWQE